MAKVSVDLPFPHASQAIVLDESVEARKSGSRFFVIKAGRRWGKTIMGAVLAMQPALKGKPVGWFAPDYKTLLKVYKQIKQQLRGSILRHSDQEKTIDLHGGGQIEFWTLENEDAGRSREYARIVIDEAAMVRKLDEIWLGSIQPTLTDRRGDAWFISTTIRGSYFSDLYNYGQNPEMKLWRSWRRITADNPYITTEVIEETQQEYERQGRMAEFRQEYLGEEMDPNNAFFPSSILDTHRKYVTEPIRCSLVRDEKSNGSVRAKFIADPAGKWYIYSDDITPSLNANYAFGIDIALGKGESNSVIAVGDRDNGRLVAEYVDPFIPAHELARVADMAGRTVFRGQSGYAFVGWESTGPGEGFYAMLVELDYPFLYYRRTEGTRSEPKTRRYGWAASRTSKTNQYNRFRGNLASHHVKISSAQGIKELSDIVYYDNHTGIGPSRLNDDPSGARSAHGDRVTAYVVMGLAIREAPMYETPESKYSYNQLGYHDGHREDYEADDDDHVDPLRPRAFYASSR